MVTTAKVKRTKSKIPRFETLEEEAEFWDSHSTTEFEDELTPVKLTPVAPMANILAVRMDAQTIDKLAAISRRKGIGPSTLARMWLLERLEQEAPAK